MPSIENATIRSRVLCNALSQVDLALLSGAVDSDTVINLSNGTGAGKANQIFADTRTLAASATEDLDLAGVLVDFFGATITFTKIKYIKIIADAANTNNVVIGAGTAPWIGLLNAAGTITLRPGAHFAAGDASATGMPVVATTGDILKILNSAGTTVVNYTVIIIGEA
jgi:hypothetical protein